MTTTISPPPQWSRRRAEKARRLDQVRSLADGVVLPSERIVEALELLIAPGDRVVLEGNNQKQADFLSRSLAKADPARLHDLHMIMPSVSRAEHLDLFERGIARKLDFSFAGTQSLRISQLLSNLLGNAVTHGSNSTPIILKACAENDEIVISLTNQGTPISAQLMPLLFEPFSRAEAGQRCEGLGLGLYIASQIATAHNGTLSVTSSAEAGTCFVARFPARYKWL